MKRINKTQLIATPTLEGEDALRLLESLKRKPSEESKKNGEILIDYFKEFEKRMKN